MYILKNEYLEVKAVVASQGLEIISIKHDKDEILYQQDGSWGKTWPILFPICGNVTGPFIYDQKSYLTPRHGFFSQIKDWEVEIKSDENVIFMFRAHDQFKSIYPFDFDLVINLKLKKNKLVYTFEIINIGEKVMYYSFGHHPAFKVDSSSKVVFDNLQSYTDKSGIGGTYLPNQDTNKVKEIIISEIDFSDSKSLLFDQFSLDHICYYYQNKKIKMSFNNEPYFVIWKSTNAMDFVCLEPYWGLPDLETRISNEYKDKLAIRELGPKNTSKFEMTIEVE
ncbi:aldose 1-epimerase [Spiroplasma helicoides]|uniref:Aldose 1-epimerase n=1 Tax=Spiroplasma helicoides TaxID=216938 RepID=A0A1B3SLM6_9MOLU|nr:hypothetical protein [Spiroplasma helicoides]AOG60841.1 aldose 1-epimerase [Spiroplasma helicoides]